MATPETHQPAMGPYLAVAAAAFELYSVAAVFREALSAKVWPVHNPNPNPNPNPKPRWRRHTRGGAFAHWRARARARSVAWRGAVRPTRSRLQP